MVPNLFEAITLVQYRYFNQWHPSTLPPHLPSLHEALELIEALDKQLQNFSFHQPAPADTLLPNRKSLKKLIRQKHECLIDEWAPCPPPDSMGGKWYLHDRLLYNGFNHILSLIITHSQTKLDLSTCPPLCRLADDNGWLAENITGHADPNIHKFAWVKKFHIFAQTIPYHVARKKLRNAIAGMLPHVNERETGYALYESIAGQTPKTRQEEMLMVVAMTSIHHLLLPHPNARVCEIIRELIYHLVNSTDIYVHWIMEQLDICLEHWKRNRNTIEHYVEYNFWCNQQQCAPNDIYLNYLILQLAAINEQGVGDVNLKKPALTWTLSVKEFIQHFHPMIAKGTITHNGNNDMVPIVNSLHRLFEIPKARGLGSVSRQSLLTYFKNTNAERKDKYGMKIRG